MKISAPAKINLCLDVLEKTPSGFHKIKTVFHEIPHLADEIEITSAEKEDKVTMNISIKKEENLAHKALKLIKKTFKIEKFAKITIQKNIPLSSGLGGASSDAAAVLRGLNKLWELNLSDEKLKELGAQIGSDIPFFINGGTAIGEHFGEKITQLPPIKNIKFEITPQNSWPNLPIQKKGQQKTASMYNSLDLAICARQTEKTKSLIEAIKKQDQNEIIQNLHNDFETIAKVKSDHHLSGSGPAAYTANPF